MKTLPIPGILLVLFVFCKLAGLTRIAEWSWWWVMSPAWVVLILCILAVVAEGINRSTR